MHLGYDTTATMPTGWAVHSDPLLWPPPPHVSFTLTATAAAVTPQQAIALWPAPRRGEDGFGGVLVPAG